ncbi:MAG: phosphoribosyl-AMP cyclohydrolase [Kiritimatiellia bacterium]|nr:phosphoribosyl-AMP cyclohydrolase [Kiritimatiellia bacterium]
MDSLEETSVLRLDFDKLANSAGLCRGVLPVTVQNINTGEVILLAYTNKEAFSLALRKRSLILWSTSRNELWEKGGTSGETFELIEVYVNCEQNALLYRVRPRRRGICHTRNKAGNPRNCFYRRINLDTLRLENIDP